MKLNSGRIMNQGHLMQYDTKCGIIKNDGSVTYNVITRFCHSRYSDKFEANQNRNTEYLIEIRS